MFKKKLLSLVACSLLFILNALPIAAYDQPKVTVTTSFLYDMVRQITEDTVAIDLIIPAGADPHLYEPKAQDASKILDSQLVLYHGLHFEGKMAEILEQNGIAVAKDFSNEQLGEMEEDGEVAIDPHFWFDLTLYKQAVTTASNALQEKFSEHKELYAKNTEKYLTQLDELDRWIKEELAKLPENKRYLVTPHDAFNYFARSYGFEVYAPQGISTDSEVSNQQIKETVQFIVDHKIPAIFAESTTNPERMTKLQEAAKTQGFDVVVVHGEGEELFSDSLAPNGEFGDNFIDMYRHNISLIVKYLVQ